MADDPTNAELGRRLDQIYGSIQALIGRGEYTEFQRALEHRFTELSRDIDDIRRQHDSDHRDMEQRITDEAKTAASRSQWKTMLWVGLIPSLVAAAGILITIWFHGKGGG